MSIPGYRPVPVVPNGPRAFRFRIRRLGPFVALLPALFLGVAAGLLLRGNTSTPRGLAGFLTSVLAVPALLPFGIPLDTSGGRVKLAVLVSAGVWLAVGMLAASRATRSPVASWRDFWREYAWLAGAIWLGAIVGLGVIQVAVGRLLL